MPHFNDKLYQIVLVLAVGMHASGFPVTIIGTDGTLYATIAKTMVETGNYLDLYVQGKDWLDKPHFPFWVTALSFKLIGINTFAYKFPALIFTLLGALYTYLFARELYGKQVARIAVLILLAAEHLVVSSNDVRAEPYLTGLVIISTYYFFRAYRADSFIYLCLASLAAACAVMTKGIFVLIVIGAAIGGGLLIKGEWKQIVHWRWLVALVLVFVFILPELYSLYNQFDRHPEKEVFGRNGVSGLRFFFWDSQFGRFNNTGPIKGSGSPLFFVHTLLWAFLPWCLFFYSALVRKMGGFSGGQKTEWFNFCGSLVGVALFSLSAFQLPHYTNILFPFFAIITAEYIVNRSLNRGWGKVLYYFHLFVFVLLCCFPIALFWFVRPSVTYANGVTASVIIAGALAVAWLVAKRKEKSSRLVYFGVVAMVVVNVFLNLVIFPTILTYQSGSEAAFWVNDHHPEAQLAHYDGRAEAFAFEFYAHQPVKHWEAPVAVPQESVIVYVSAERKEELESNYVVSELKRFSHYHISKLTANFLSARKRHQVLTDYFLVKVENAKLGGGSNSESIDD